MFNSVVNDKKICVNSKYWWSEDLGYLITEKNRIGSKRIKFNKLRNEIEIMKRDNIELHNAIQEQINLNMGHKKAWKKAKQQFNPIRKDIPAKNFANI